MGLALRDDLAGALGALGLDWPQSDEDALLEAARHWRQFATALGHVRADAESTAAAVHARNTGDALDAFGAHWHRIGGEGGRLAQIQRDAGTVAGVLERHAEVVRAAKHAAVDQLGPLAAVMAAGTTVAAELAGVRWRVEEILAGPRLSVEQDAARALEDVFRQPPIGGLNGIVASVETAAGLIASRLLGGQGVHDLPPPPPEPNASPRDVWNWWTNLSWDQRQAEIVTNPGQIGRLNGIPADIRDQANRTVLNEKIAALEASNSNPGDLANLRGLLAELDTENPIDPNDPSYPRAYLLNFDDQHLDDHVIVAFGNPDYSDNVVTMVPGGTQLGDLLPGNGNVGELAWARNVYDAGRNADPKQTTSVITWMDYHSPTLHIGPADVSFLAERGDMKDAIAGGASLNEFQQGLRQTHIQRPYALPLHMVLIGHSFGSTVVGESSQQPDYQPPDDMIMTGSPGMGVHGLRDLHLPSSDGRTHLWVATSATDPAVIASRGGAPIDLGADPGQEPDAVRIATDDLGHDDYYKDPNLADMKSIGNIAVGNYGGVVGTLIPPG